MAFARGAVVGLWFGVAWGDVGLRFGVAGTAVGLGVGGGFWLGGFRLVAVAAGVIMPVSVT